VQETHGQTAGNSAVGRNLARANARPGRIAHGLWTVRETRGKKRDSQVFFKRYRNTTLDDHLCNLLGSIRIQKHHLIETKRPRPPLKLPHLRYRTRDLRELRIILKFDFKWAKDPYKRKSGGIYNPPTLHTTRPNQPK